MSFGLTASVIATQYRQIVHIRVAVVYSKLKQSIVAAVAVVRVATSGV
jgi:hypothetical protein